MRNDSTMTGVEMFPISRDPPEGGTAILPEVVAIIHCFQFLGIPPKGERVPCGGAATLALVSNC